MSFSPKVSAFLVRPLHAVLATLDETGGISQSVVWYRVDGDTVWISCKSTSAKARHVEAEPRVSLLVLAPHGGSYVRVEGKGRLDGIVTEDERLALVSPYQGADAEGWLADHPLESPNVRLRITPDRVVSRGL